MFIFNNQTAVYGMIYMYYLQPMTFQEFCHVVMMEKRNNHEESGLKTVVDFFPVKSKC